MSLNGNPVKLVLGAPYVTEVVREFARKQGLEFNARYHNEDLWRVESQDNEGVVRQVQIAAFEGEQGPGLYFIPQASRWVEGDQEVVGSKTCAAAIRAIPLGDFYRAAMEGRKSDLTHDLKRTLTATWEAAQAFKASDLVKLSAIQDPPTPQPA